MSREISDLDRARANVSAASSGGAPFLFAFALTLGVTGVFAFWWDVRTIALITLFQGNVALPLAFWLERRMSTVRLTDDNPLRPLSIQLAMSQILGLPAVIFVYQFAPAAVPAAMAGIGAAHFLPYAWLQRTQAYLGLGVAAAVGPFALTLALGPGAPPWVLLFLSTLYLGCGVVVFRRARSLVSSDVAAGIQWDAQPAATR